MRRLGFILACIGVLSACAGVVELLPPMAGTWIGVALFMFGGLLVVDHPPHSDARPGYITDTATRRHMRAAAANDEALRAEHFRTRPRA